jgi:hypothetical protein
MGKLDQSRLLALFSGLIRTEHDATNPVDTTSGYFQPFSRPTSATRFDRSVLDVRYTVSGALNLDVFDQSGTQEGRVWYLDKGRQQLLNRSIFPTRTIASAKSLYTSSTDLE